MSVLDDLTAGPYVPPGGKSAPSALDSLSSAGFSSPKPAAAPAGPSGLDSLVARPYQAHSAPESAPSPYFQGRDNGSGAFLGISSEKDPYSGTPYFAYKLPGQATTTDPTRVATTFDPRLALPHSAAEFHNERMPSSASQGMRSAAGATADQELDHAIPLELSGSNDPANLRLEDNMPGSHNTPTDAEENANAHAVAAGTESLFAAQLANAKAKGLPAPFTGSVTDDHVARGGLIDDVLHAPDDSTLGIIKNTIMGLPSAAGKVGLDILRAGPRAAVSTQLSINSMLHQAGQPGFTPSNPIEKFLFGPDTIPNVYDRGVQTLQSVGVSEPIAKRWGLPMGMALTGLDMYPGSPEAGAAEKIAASTDAGEIEKIIAKTWPTLKDQAPELAEHLAGVRDAKEVAQTVTSAAADTVARQVGDHLAANVDEYGVSYGEPIKQHTVEDLRNAYKDAGMHPEAPGFPKSDAELANVASELELSRPGERVFTPGTVGGGSEVHGVSSTFPDWVPENLRSSQLFAKIMPNLETDKLTMPPSSSPKQQALANAIYDELDHRLGVDTKAIRSSIIENERGQKEASAAARGGGARGGQEGGAGRVAGGGGRGAAGGVKPAALADDFVRQAQLQLRYRENHGLADALGGINTKGVKSYDDLEKAVQGVPGAAENPDVANWLKASKQQFDFYQAKAALPAAAKPSKMSVTVGGGVHPNVRKTPGFQEGVPFGPADRFSKDVTEANGGVVPPMNKGGLMPPEINFAKGKDIAAIRLSTDTMERNIEKIFGDQADKINKWLIEPIRNNETRRVRFVTNLREQMKKDVVDNLGIKPGTKASGLVQRYGEKRMSLDELKAERPNDWENITKASDYFKNEYGKLLGMWNRERAANGMAPVPMRQDYFRHFLELNDFASKFGFNFRETALPTQISGITAYFKSQTPWASAAQRRFNGMFTEDAIKGMDNYLDTTSRAIFHTDSVQRGRLFEKYLRAAGGANGEIKLPNFAANLTDWTNLVSGKQAMLDRSLETVFGRTLLAPFRAMTKRFGANVIAGNISAAVTHTIPFTFTLATVDKGAAFQGLIDTLRSPTLADFTQIDGRESSFLARRFGREAIEPTATQKVAHALSSPFHWADQFISRFAVSAKYNEGLADGLSPAESMAKADNYAARVIGDRSTGNLPNLMNTKTLGFLSQFQIEVNDNLRVLIHDIPRWEEGNVPRIASRLAQFALYSYLFNQSMQAIKGSGKGLDPIGLGLTLAGLNDEGGDKSVSERLGLFVTDLAKELPFASIPTQGQIPSAQPLIGLGQGVQGALTGNMDKLKSSAANFAESYVSPIGGGIQAGKTLGGIEAWRQGFVTDTAGNVTAKIPQTIPSLIQGSLFGKSAWPEVQKSKEEVQRLNETIKGQQTVSKQKDQQAAAIWRELHGMDPEAAKQQLMQVAQQDPDMAQRVLNEAKSSAAGMTKEDTLVHSLGVKNGQRARYFVQKMQKMGSDDERKQYLLEQSTKKLLTADVLSQVVQLMNKP